VTSTRTPPSFCLDCGKKLDAAAAVREGAEPKPDDISLCIYCGHIMMYAPDLTLRELTDDEIVEIAGRPDVVEARKIIFASRGIFATNSKKS